MWSFITASLCFSSRGPQKKKKKNTNDFWTSAWLGTFHACRGCWVIRASVRHCSMLLWDYQEGFLRTPNLVTIVLSECQSCATGGLVKKRCFKIILWIIYCWKTARSLPLNQINQLVQLNQTDQQRTFKRFRTILLQLFVLIKGHERRFLSCYFLPIR